MASLGELFIELGVVGDVKPLEKAIKATKEMVKQIDNEIKKNQTLLKYLQDIKNARSASEKSIIKENFANEVKKQKMLDEIDNNQKAIDGKKEYAKSIAGIVKGVGLFVGALTGAAVAINKFTNDLVQSNQAMLDLTRTTDIAQNTFQKWGSVGKLLGVENAAQQLEGLNQRLFDLMLTGEGARGFQLAGINPVGQDAEGVLEQLRSRIGGMNDAAATYLLQQMGLDPKMLHLLRLTREEFEGLNSAIKQYRISPEQTKQIQAMNIQLQISGIRLRYLKDRAILALMPAWTKFMASLARVAEGLAQIHKWLTTTNAGMITAAATITTVLIPAIKLLLATITAHPVVAAITAIIGVLYLLIDDIVGYFQGKDSLVGVVLNFFDEFQKAVTKNINTPQWIQDILALLANVDKLEKLANTVDKINSGQKVEATAIQANAATAKTALKTFGIFNPLINGMTVTSDIVDVIKMLTTPQMQQQASMTNQTINNNNADNRISMTNYFNTSQPALDLQNQLNHARFAQIPV